MLDRRGTAGLALVGGSLWILSGPFTMLRPWGTDVVYREALGYSAVTDVPLFVLYNLPGALALILSAVALLGVIALLQRDAGGLGKVARALTYVALGLGFLSLGGVVVLFDRAGATVIAVFGIGWVWIGRRLWNEAEGLQPSTEKIR